ncbi:hypothetical protein AAFG13_06140 [Bradyrhizobium sp. B124]|uniref:hypothetical protein n=1 Tax=Bradyrhizobium sp. B124 TaxID=3140245 RepID=UPI003183FA15
MSHTRHTKKIIQRHVEALKEAGFATVGVRLDGTVVGLAVKDNPGIEPDATLTDRPKLRDAAELLR